MTSGFYFSSAEVRLSQFFSSSVSYLCCTFSVAVYRNRKIYVSLYTCALKQNRPSLFLSNWWQMSLNGEMTRAPILDLRQFKTWILFYLFFILNSHEKYFQWPEKVMLGKWSTCMCVRVCKYARYECLQCQRIHWITITVSSDKFPLTANEQITHDNYG